MDEEQYEVIRQPVHRLDLFLEEVAGPQRLGVALYELGSRFFPTRVDVFTRAIRGWHLGRSLERGLTLAAPERALVVAAPQIHHSHQGVQ